MGALEKYQNINCQKARMLFGIESKDTFQKGFREVIGLGFTDERMLTDEELKSLAIRFSKNYPSARTIADELADVKPSVSTDTDKPSRMSIRTDTDARTVTHPQGRNYIRTDNNTDTDEIQRMQVKIADFEKQLSDNQEIIKKLEAQKAFDADRIQNLSKQLADERKDRKEALDGRANEVASVKDEKIRMLTDEIEKFNAKLTDERKERKAAIEGVATEVASAKDVKIQLLTEENERLNSKLEDAEYKNTSVEAVVTDRLEKAKKEWDRQVNIKMQEQNKVTGEKMVAYETQLHEKEDEIRALSAELKNYEQISKNWNFQLKALWNDEMQTINVISAMMAIGGFTFSLGPVGFVIVLVMVLFYKNILKNLSKALRSKTVQQGMYAVIGIELIWGYFHFNTFKSALEYFNSHLMFGTIDQVTTFLVIVFTSLSIRAFYQKRNQIKDDFKQN
jgi:uncharacterized coiled-coil protein SlyX